jgi:colicin import membrane protein
MVTAVGDAKVTDFGIAKILGSSKLTRTGTAMGSAHYMSPEQIRRPETADSRSDIYSLGCVFYEVLTGRPPFGDKDISGTESDYDVKTSHVTEAAPALGTVKSGIPAWLAKLVMSMLEKAPDHRPSSCEAILEKLKAIDSGEKNQLVETAEKSDLEAPDYNKKLDQYDYRSIAKISFLAKQVYGLFNKGILAIAVLIILVTSIYLLRGKTKSLMLQQVEPPKMEVSSPETQGPAEPPTRMEPPYTPEPIPAPPKSAPEPKPPAPVVAPEPPKVKTADPDIALEQEKKRKLQKEKEKLAEEKQQREEQERKQLAEEQKRQKEEKALKDKKRLEEDQKRKQEAAEAEEQKRKQEAAAAEEQKRKEEAAAEEKRKQEKAAENRSKARRAQDVDRLLSLVGDGEAGTAEKKSGAPGSVCELYIGKTVKSNTSFPDMPGNLVVTVRIRLTASRMLKEVNVVSPSEYPAFDNQIERGIRKSGQFPAECPDDFTYAHFLKPR